MYNYSYERIGFTIGTLTSDSNTVELEYTRLTYLGKQSTNLQCKL